MLLFLERSEVLNCTLVCLCASPCSFLTHPRACAYAVLCRKLTAEPDDCNGRCAGNLHDRLGVCSRNMTKTGSKFQPAVFSCLPGQGWDMLLHVEAIWRWRDWLGNILLTDNAFLPTNFHLERKTIFWHSDLEGLPRSVGISVLWHPVHPQVVWQKWQADVSKQGALHKDWPLQVTWIRALSSETFSMCSH